MLNLYIQNISHFRNNTPRLLHHLQQLDFQCFDKFDSKLGFKNHVATGEVQLCSLNGIFVF